MISDKAALVTANQLRRTISITTKVPILVDFGAIDHSTDGTSDLPYHCQDESNEGLITLLGR